MAFKVKPLLWLGVGVALALAVAPLSLQLIGLINPEQGAYTSSSDPRYVGLERYRPLSTNGPLRVSERNPRYFTDRNGKIVYLVGSHTWTNLQDAGGSYPPPAFDFRAYLDFLDTNNHNFFRLWCWEQPRWTLETSDHNYWIDPLPYLRTRPGAANDGMPKFDLTKFNQAYFDRMRERVKQAAERGMYVSVMLFNGWSVRRKVPGFALNNPWRSHPFNGANNINGIDADLNGDDSGEESHGLLAPTVTALQEAYVRKVIDTVGDLDNVLYEISNESQGGSRQWQYHMINFIKRYESQRPLQHPVGMTAEWPDGNNNDLWASPADWISPSGGVKDRPIAIGQKVILADTDHFCGKCGDRAWVWKSFTRGENPIFMDAYHGEAYGQGGKGYRFDTPNWVSVRANLGYTLAYSGRIDLSAAKPRGDLTSTGYALANPSHENAEYLVYFPTGGTAVVDLSGTPGPLHLEWFNPRTGEALRAGEVAGGGPRHLTAPFAGDAVLYLHSGTKG